jgi:hypothetical protein
LPKRKTTCEFIIAVDDIAVWPAYGADNAYLEIQIDDLLSYLTEFWKPLMLRQVYPIKASPRLPSELRQVAEQRWADFPDSLIEAEEDAVSDFEEAHDLSRCFSGYFGLPAFWILRTGTDFILETKGVIHKVPFDDVRKILSECGDWICDRLSKVDLDRWDETIEAWRCRGQADAIGLLSWSTGIDRSISQNLIEEGILDAPSSFDDVANDNDELRIAARMAGALSADQIRRILYLARGFEKREAVGLSKLAQECASEIQSSHTTARPFHQGEAAARFVREQLGLPPRSPIDIFKIASTLGIEVRHGDSEPLSLDGLAIWGERHGPGVFLNRASRRIIRDSEENIEHSAGARVTLAHELCHFLLDGGHALSAIEVLNARMPPGVEQRAKSFAGEFLLPRWIASEIWFGFGCPEDRVKLNQVLEDLVGSYGVTRSVAAWKLEHAARAEGIDISVSLNVLAPYR